MAEYDGSIRIDTEIRIKKAKENIAELESDLKGFGKAADDARKSLDVLNSKGVPKNDKAYENQAKALSAYSARLHEVAKAREELLHEMERGWDVSKGDIFDDAAYQEQFSLWQEAESRAREYASSISQYFEHETITNSVKEQSQATRDFSEHINLLKADVEEYGNSLKELEAQGKYFGDEDYDKVYLAWQEAKKAVKDYQKQLLYGNTPIESEKRNIESLSSGFERVKDSAKRLFSVISNIGGIGGKAFGALKNAASKAFSAIHKGTKKSSGLLSTFASRLKGITLSLLIFNWITKGFNAMVSGMKTGFGNLMQYSSDFSNSVQSMKNAMATLGNQFAAAFAPIVQMVIPWLRSLINALSTAMSYVAQFIALLGGKSTFTRAKQIQDSYNKSLGGTASAAKKAYGALAKFDDLDVLQKKEDDASGAGAGVTQPEGMFEEVPIDPKLLDLFDWLKDMWENADFYELGKMLGEKLKEALDNIPWDEIKEAARRLGKSLASLINGFIEVEGLGYSIGRTLAEAINTGFEFLNSFVHELHWGSIGKFISDTINGFFENIDLGLIWRTLVTLARGLSTLLNNFVKNINVDAITTAISSLVNTIVQSIRVFFVTADWKSIGQTIGKLFSDTIKKIDWKGMATTISEVGKSLLELFDSAVESVEWDEVGYAIRDFLEGINWTELLQGLGDLIEDALVSAIDMAVAAIGGEDFYNKFKEWQANNREKRDQAMQGGNWFEDSKDGGNPYEQRMADMQSALDEWRKTESQKREEIESDRQKWWENAHNQFSDAWTSLKESAATAWDNIKQTISDKLTSLKESILLGWENIKQFFSDTWTGIKETAIEIWTGLQEWFGEFWTSFTENLSIVWENIKTFFSDTWNGIKENASAIWTAVKDFFSTTWEGIKANASTAWNAIKTFFQTTWTNIKAIATTIWTAIKTFMQTTWENVKTFAQNTWNNIKTFLINAWTAIKEKAISIWEAIRRGFEEKINAVRDKMEEIKEKFDSFREKVFSVFENIKETVVSAIDAVKGAISGFIGLVESAISAIQSLISSASSIGGSIGSAISGFLGISAPPGIQIPVGYDITSEMANKFDIPHLASGSVIQGGRPFAAILGDQPRGQVNIEAPLATIEQAVENAMGRFTGGTGFGGTMRVVLNVNGTDLAQVTLNDFLSEMNRQGYDVSVLGVT